MAASPEKGQELSPEEKLAQIVRGKRGLSNPIDIFFFAQTYAKVEVAPIPFDADGLTLNAKGTNPEIIISSHIPIARQKFTLAHELGHILIPWHVGDIVSHVEAFSDEVDYEYRTFEAEANRFAAELLLPLEWIRSLLVSNGPAEVSKRVQSLTGLSWIAITLRICSAGRPGFAYAEVDSHNRVVRFGQTLGSKIRVLARGETIDVAKAFAFKCNFETIDVPGSKIVWWDLESFDHSIPTIWVEEDSRQVLMGIFADLGVDGETQKTFSSKINGVIGAAKSMNHSKTPEDLYAVLISRFANRKEYSDVVRHSQFKVFLGLHVRQVFSKR